MEENKFVLIALGMEVRARSIKIIDDEPGHLFTGFKKNIFMAYTIVITKNRQPKTK